MGLYTNNSHATTKHNGRHRDEHIRQERTGACQLELELELTQTLMTQKPVLRVEVEV